MAAVPLRILHIGKFDRRGGAAMAGWRLHEALLDAGHDSRMLVGTQTTEDARVGELRDGSLRRLRRKVLWHLGLNNLAGPSVKALKRIPAFRDAEVLHLNNLHDGFFDYRTLSVMAKWKPLVWTLHDMWAFTGHCSYSFDCGRWRTGCGRCPYPETYPYIARDATRTEWALKRKAFQRARPHLVTPSRWLAGEVAQSMLSGLSLEVIPYAVDTGLYCPHADARVRLGIESDKVVLLAVAHQFSEARKGAHLLWGALRRLSQEQRARVCLLLMGGEIPRCPVDGIEIRSMGYVSDDLRKSLVYGAADLTLFPTLHDNLPLVIQESLACGTPVMASAVGGCPEMVIAGETGFPVASNDPEVWGGLLDEVLQNREKLGAYRGSAREWACRNYSAGEVADRYLSRFVSAIREYAEQQNDHGQQ